MHELTILVPTRERPENARRLMEAFTKTCTSDTELIFVVDDNDPRLFDYVDCLDMAARALIVPPGRRGMVDATNEAFRIFQPELGFAVGFFGDDVLPRTDGWDTELLKELRELGTGVAYGNDLLQGERIATHPVLTTDIPRTLGWLAYPGLEHLCVDVVIQRLGAELGKLAYRDDVILEHLHPANRKAPNDAGYRAVNSLAVQSHDGAVMNEYLESDEFRADIERLRTLL